VMRAGKLAVVLGIEVDHLFSCRHPQDLTAAEVERVVGDYYALGVRHVFPIHFGNNGFGGGSLETPLVRAVDQPYFSGANPVGTLGLYGMHSEDGRADGLAYRKGRRNRLGLTNTGRALIEALMSRGMVIDINHMSWRSRSDTLDMCEEIGYPVIAGHSTFLGSTSMARRHEAALTDEELDRVRRLRGMVGVILDQEVASAGHGVPARERDRGDADRSVTAAAVAAAYRYAVSHMDDDLPVGIGTDLNGFARLPGPRFGTGAGETLPPGKAVSYPFTSPTGISMDRSRIGERSFDINADGMAHVGMLPDFIEELMSVGVSMSELDSLMRSAHGYVSLWDRAVRRAGASSP
jgi:microsomal dipeptidase-like Zn-dependent dipeptidase